MKFFFCIRLRQFDYQRGWNFDRGQNLFSAVKRARKKFFRKEFIQECFVSERGRFTNGTFHCSERISLVNTSFTVRLRNVISNDGSWILNRPIVLSMDCQYSFFGQFGKIIFRTKSVPNFKNTQTNDSCLMCLCTIILEFIIL